MTAATETFDDTVRDLAGGGTAAEPSAEPDMGGYSGDEDEHPMAELREQFRLLLPGHAFIQLTNPAAQQAAPRVVLVGPGGQHFAVGGPVPAGMRVCWSTPNGIWKILAAGCPDNSEGSDDLYSVKVRGPETKLTRVHVTYAQIEQMLRSVGAVN